VSSGPGNIIIRIGAQTADAVRDLGKVNSSLGDTMTTSQKASAGIKKAALPAAAALGAIGFAAIDATKAALEDAAAQDKLAGQLKRTTGATDAQIASAEDYITKMSLQTGVADDELRPALGKLATATGSVTKAQDALKLALDISAQTGKSMDQVSTALAKGYGGNTAALGKLIPGLDKATLATKDMGKITEELADLTAGAATDAADTAAGQYKVWQVQMQELKETLGASLIPVVQQLGRILQSVTGFASEHTTAVKVLIGVVAGLAGGIIAINAALKVYEAAQIAVKAATVLWTAAQYALNVALNLNPIGIVVLALGALTGAIILAYQKSETFRNIVQGAMDVVRTAVGKLDTAFDALRAAAIATFNWITDHWKVAQFFFGPVAVAITQIAQNFDAIKAAATTAFEYVTKVWNVGKFAFGAIEDAVRGIASAFDAVYNAVRGAIGAVQDLIAWLGRIKVPHIKLPDLNPFGAAAGAPAVRGARGARAGSAAAAGGIQINVYGAVDPEGTARAIQRLLSQHERRIGRAP